MRRAVLEEVRKHFRPEFLNRLDEIIVFHRLGARADGRASSTSSSRASRSASRGASSRSTITPPAKDFLVEEGWDPQYGARPLKRAIQRYLEDALAKKILAGEFGQGDTVADRRRADDRADVRRKRS